MASDIIPWTEDVLQTKKLRMLLDDSLGRSGWAKVFKDAIDTFNALARSTWKVDVTWEETTRSADANVIVYAKGGDFDFEYDGPDFKLAKKRVPFDGQSIHGHCSLAHGKVRNRTLRIDETRLQKAFIFVPSKAHTGGSGSRPVGDPVKLVVAVHEMIHAAGGLDNSHHTVDDVFCWPKAAFGNKPADDRVEAFTGRRVPIVIAGQQRTKPEMLSMPPIVLNAPTQKKLRSVWA